MIKQMVTSALIAGFAAGLLAALLHFAFVQKLILLGEEYESGALVHFGASGTRMSHDQATPQPAAPAQPEAAAEPSDHGADGHHHEATDEDPTTRNLLTSLFFGVTYVAYGLILVAGFNLATSLGKTIDLRVGLLWGLAGFAAFQLAPALGLPPELPGTIAADLRERQIWWLGTALATGGGLALIAYGRGALAIAAGIALLAAPHVIGAPELDGYFGVAPPEVASAFAARTLGIGLIVWAFLGGLAGRLWQAK
ncbi:MAG: CbtA family protein [Cypionkella sp.]